MCSFRKIIVVFVTFWLFFGINNLYADDAHLVITKKETIKPRKDMDEISQFMYSDGRFAVYQVFFQIGNTKVELTEMVSSQEGIRRTAESNIVKQDLTNDGKFDYIIFLYVGRSVGLLYVIDGANNKKIFSPNWLGGRCHYSSRYNINNQTITEELSIEGKTVRLRQYIWDRAKKKFIIKR